MLGVVAGQLGEHEDKWSVRMLLLVRTRFAAGRVRSAGWVLRADAPREGVIETPPLLCAEVLQEGDRGLLHRFYGRASKMRLKGVWAARRKRRKPAAVMTSPMRFSPAWAPRAAPTSYEREAGTQSRAEAEQKTRPTGL